MSRSVCIAFLFLGSFIAEAAPREFLIETKLDRGSTRPANFSMRVAEGERASISSHSMDPSDKTDLSVSAQGLGEGFDGSERVVLNFTIEVSNNGKIVKSQPKIIARIGEPASLIIAEKGQEPLRLQVKALRR